MTTKYINDWDPEVRSLLVALLAAGFNIIATDNGEDFIKEPTLEQAVKELTACDEASLYIKRPLDEKEFWLYLVLGNSPGELVADYTYVAKEKAPNTLYESFCVLETVLDLQAEAWDGKAQPRIEAEKRYGKQ